MRIRECGFGLIPDLKPIFVISNPVVEILKINIKMSSCNYKDKPDIS